MATAVVGLTGAVLTVLLTQFTVAFPVAQDPDRRWFRVAGASARRPASGWWDAIPRGGSTPAGGEAETRVVCGGR